VDSLNTIRAAAPGLLGFLCRPMRADETIDASSEEALSMATENYLTAKINQGLMDLEQLMLQKAMFEQQQRQVQLASGVLPPNNNRRPQG